MQLFYSKSPDLHRLTEAAQRTAMLTGGNKVSRGDAEPLTLHRVETPSFGNCQLCLLPLCFQSSILTTTNVTLYRVGAMRRNFQPLAGTAIT
jgi:hypothetical protein